MTSPLELLPLIILERISEYLDDQPATRQSLRAFCLTSKSCHAATESQRFSQIELKIRYPQYLHSALTRWNDILAGGQQRHVRRLKISEFETAEDKDMARKTGRHRQKEDLYKEAGDEWNTRHYFQVHDFCRPSYEEMCYDVCGVRISQSESWDALSHFIGELPGLQDLVWAAGSYVPPGVLSITAERGIRLHVYDFYLPSLVQAREAPEPISTQDYTLYTLPSLYSITVRASSFVPGGKVSYIQDAVIQMVARRAPNLAHLCMVPTTGSRELGSDLDQTVSLGRPNWKGFFPEQVDSTQELEGVTARSSSSSRGKLQTLVFPMYVPGGIEHWARHTDFSRLSSLVMSWERGNGIALTTIASQGNLKYLKKLRLFCINDDETKSSQHADINLLFSSLNPLERLDASGYIGPTTFDIITRQHGPGLRALKISSCLPYDLDGRESLLVTFSGPVLEKLAANSPHLTHLDISINRTRGDKHEVAIYRALSRFPRLEHVALRLGFRVGPDGESWDKESNGPHPLQLAAEERDSSKIPLVYLQEAFSNGAIDEKLARSIFEVIAGGKRNTLRYLRLQPFRQMTPGDPGNDSIFRSTLIWFNRSFVCKRDSQRLSEVTVHELDYLADFGCLADGEEQWSYMASATTDEDFWHGEEAYVAAFKAVWPPKTKEWWRDWESLPLDLGE
ncbi:hypothetical protein BKA61DRAFT_716884 [Leptodontidium sp. MPI-SDFR-AT-0119]|nr:hypothetical protein BKA61DRAFT_716884 [Leptodontidium sp. MPI-SDFR-AT-0119]